MAIQYFVDDSGGSNQGPVIVMGGLWASAEKWAEFSTEWQECLDQSPRLEYFKMQFAAQRTGTFSGFSEAQRDAKVKALAEILNRHVAGRLALPLDSGPSLKYPQPKKSRKLPFEQPYFWAFNYFIQTACLEQFHQGQRERIEIIFDKHKLKDRARDWYPFMLLLLPPVVRAIAPTEILFRCDQDMRPLQGADMIAWLARRDQSGEENEFRWIESLLPSVPPSPFGTKIEAIPPDAQIPTTAESLGMIGAGDREAEFSAELKRLLEEYGISDDD